MKWQLHGTDVAVGKHEVMVKWSDDRMNEANAYCMQLSTYVPTATIHTVVYSSDTTASTIASKMLHHFFIRGNQ